MKAWISKHWRWAAPLLATGATLGATAYCGSGCGSAAQKVISIIAPMVGP